MKTSASPPKTQRPSPGPQEVLQRLSSAYISSFITSWCPVHSPSSSYMALLSAHLVVLKPVLIAAAPAFNILPSQDWLLLHLQSTKAGLLDSLPDQSVYRGPETGNLWQCCPREREGKSQKKTLHVSLNFEVGTKLKFNNLFSLIQSIKCNLHKS